MISYYRGPYTQKGHGFGGIFRGLTKFIAPITRGIQTIASNPTVQGIAKEALKTGASIASDALQGREIHAKEKGLKLLQAAKDKVAETLRKSTNVEDDESDSEVEDVTFKKNHNNKRRRKTNHKLKTKRNRRSIFDY